jgi:DNA-binding transcriptional regulator of glucitol operon
VGAVTARSRTPVRRPFVDIAVLLWVAVCGVACYWQVTVALAGDDLGWLYSIEWPVFGIFGIVVWWNLIHDDPEKVGNSALRNGLAHEPRVNDRSQHETTRSPSESPDLERYNEYLSALAASEKKKGWRR